MLVMVNVPVALVNVCPTVVIATPPIATTAGPSPWPTVIEPLVVSLFAAAFEPAGSPPRAGRPLS